MTDTLQQLNADDFRFNPPSFARETLSDLLTRRFGVTGELKPLAGERDQNTHVRTADGQDYVLKIASPNEDFELVDLQIKSLEHIARADPGLPVPKHVRDVDGNLSTTLTDKDGTPHHVRLLDYLPGIPLDTLPRPSDKMITAIGAMQGRLCCALKGFEHAGAEKFMVWDLMNGMVVQNIFRTKFLPPDMVDDCAPHLDRLQHHSLPRMANLPAQVIHNDAHLGNLLTATAQGDSVSGVIDFGDLIKRPIIIDLAASLANLIEAHEDIVQCCRALLTGFEQHMPVAREQKELLFDALFAREAQTVQLFQFRLDYAGPDSDIEDTLLPNAIAGLRKLLALDPDQVTAQLIAPF